MKNKIATIGIIIATIVLAGVAVFTAVRLYQLRKEAVAPNVPSSKPQAATTPKTCSALTFTLGTPTPTPTSIPQCNKTPCSSDTQCPSDLVCYRPGPQPSGPTNMGACRNPRCLTSADCICRTPTPTATPTSTPTGSPTATPTGIPGETPTSTPTATPTNIPGETNSCNGTCGSNANCNSSLFCYQGFCRNSNCPSQTSCSCPGATSTPRVTTTPAPTQPSLPDAGVSLPTIFGIGIGTLLLIGALILAL